MIESSSPKVQGIDATMDANKLTALVFPANNGAGIAAKSGYPSVIVPAGYLTTAAPSLPLREVLDGEGVLRIRRWVREVPIAEAVKDFAVRLVLSTHPQGENSLPMAQKYIQYGSSPRGLQSLILAAKARALLSGRPNVSFEDIRAVALPSLRHRIILNLEADAGGVSAETVLAEALERVAEVL